MHIPAPAPILGVYAGAGICTGLLNRHGSDWMMLKNRRHLSFPFPTSLFPPHPGPRSGPADSLGGLPPRLSARHHPPVKGALMTEEFWLTYSEAAEKLGIKIDSVKRRARARRWAKRIRNDGIAEVRIPTDALAESRQEALTARPEDNPPHEPALSERIIKAETRAAAAEARAEALEQHLADVQRDRDHWRDLTERLSQPRPSIWSRLLGRD